MRTTSGSSLALLLGILVVAITAIYHPVLRHPDATIMGASADAIKNYYTPWYHAKWDKTYTWFEGMNYPYGDHVVFADAQPLLSNLIKLTGMADHTVGIMNYLMLLSILVTGWLLYRILLRWQMDAVWAALAAAAVALLSPQVLKFNAHYGLAYTFAVPLVWHLAQRFLERPAFVRSLPLALTLFLLGWLHPYYVMISAVFLTAFWAVHSLVAWRSLKFVQRLMHFGIQVIFPLLLFTLALKLTDPVTDRPGDPYGFDQYMATWKTVFLPMGLWGLDRIPQAIWKDQAVNWEGLGYVGLLGSLMFLIYWGRTSWRLVLATIGRKLKQFQWLETAGIAAETRMLITVSMLSGVLVGLFACGVPFAFKPELTTELFPPIKQFRSLGRFSWVFFYTWASFSSYLLWAWMKGAEGWKRNLAKGVSALAMGWMLLEGVALNYGVAARIAAANPDPSSENILGAPAPAWLSKLDQQDAFMMLPYWHEGSENFHTSAPGNSRLAFQASILTGKPMLNVMMSRTSFQQSWNMIQLLTEPYADPELMNSIPDGSQILAIRTADSTHFDPSYLHSSYPDEVDPASGFQFFDLLEELYLLGHERRETALVMPARTFPVAANYVAEDSLAKVVVDDFEVAGTGHRDGSVVGYHSRFGREIFLKDNNFLHDGPLPFAAGDTVVVSLWVRLDGDRLPLTELGWEEWAGDQKVTWHYLSLNNSIVCMENAWALCEREEVVVNPQNKFQVNVTRWKRFPPQLTIDRFLIRKKGSHIYGLEDGKPATLNNRFQPIVRRD